ncbi:alpha/beta hydrolase [Antarcticimicrobium sediminis]|uniref:Alpha/beta fold hydrolase n=1 Tax=Antarcticimicrobium sediminis TaxID=2546227 RepID=A0A4R5EYK7_9RHOB|nr:alpha/beta fold hydrolase [Antarcticimicrobium sediminis]TDE40121.1 alpha/beta fold hydrolase [Antarcticimicrobium sediminis]
MHLSKRRLRRRLYALGVVLALLWAFGPYEPVPLRAGFDATRMKGGVAAYLNRQEARFDDITPGVEKRVIWQPGFRERRTPVSILYVHGFSATSQEIRPVPDRVAQALGANLVFTRLRGHGRDGAALAQASVGDWMDDMAEALEAARAVGERVVVIATSTGATLTAAALLDREMSRDVAAAVLVSPNFGNQNWAATLLALPGARYWLPLLAGRERSFEPQNDGQAIFWTSRYPTVALMPMAAMVRKVARLDYAKVQVPALFWLSDEDQVVRPDISREIAANWGGGARVQAVSLGPDDDPNAHVIAGDILSPGQSDAAILAMVDWLHAQGLR